MKKCEKPCSSLQLVNMNTSFFSHVFCLLNVFTHLSFREHLVIVAIICLYLIIQFGHYDRTLFKHWPCWNMHGCCSKPLKHGASRQQHLILTHTAPTVDKNVIVLTFYPLVLLHHLLSSNYHGNIQPPMFQSSTIQYIVVYILPNAYGYNKQQQ